MVQKWTRPLGFEAVAATRFKLHNADQSSCVPFSHSHHLYAHSIKYFNGLFCLRCLAFRTPTFLSLTAATHLTKQPSLGAAAMPVPIAVTHPSGAGLKAAQPATLDTAGPFARLAAAKEAAERAAAEQQQQQLQQGSKEQQQQNLTQQQPQTHTEQNGVCANGTQEQQPTIVVDHLDFSYPGLGGLECYSHSDRHRCSTRLTPSALSTTLLQMADPSLASHRSSQTCA